METIKTSPNVEFDVIYADGTRRHVAEGVLFEAEGYHMTYHNGTNRPAVVFAAGEAVAEVINLMGVPVRMKIGYLWNLAKALMKRKGGHKNGV